MPDPDEVPPLLTAPAELAGLVDHLRERGRFAFDTEFVSEDTYEPVLGLIQLATDDRLALVDPLAMRPDDLAPFWEALNDPAIEVVMHAGGEDLRIVHLRSGRLPDRVVDVQVSAGLVGFSYPLSLGNLVGQALGIHLAGGETRTDWRRRPLSPAQLRYAIDDVRHLLRLADQIEDRLADWGRTDWAEAESAGLLAGVVARSDEDRWRRLPGLAGLNRRALEAARRLYLWRLDDARRANRPLRYLLRDDLLVAVAKRLPASRADLEALRDFQRSHVVGRTAELLSAVAAARSTPDADLPAPFERHDDGSGLAMAVSLLGAALSYCCARYKVAPSLVGTASDLRDLVRWHVAGRRAADPPALALGWRAATCGDLLLEILDGRRALRLVDPLADVPVALEPDPGPAPPPVGFDRGANS